MLKHEKPESAHLVARAKVKTRKGKAAHHSKRGNKVSFKGNKDACFFCKEGHMKKECQKYIKWLEKKGILISFDSFFC
jgi:hypothetical protein